MKVVCFPSDDTGCGYYRIRWAALELARQGCDVEIRDQITAVWERSEGVEANDRIVGIKDLDCDVAVFQRVYRRAISVPTGVADGVCVELLQAVKAKGIRVILDIDDDLAAVDPGHVGYRFLAGCEPVMREAVRTADAVTVSTPELAKRYGGTVIPNGVPRAYLGISGRAEGRPLIGWTGFPRTHVGDLDVVGNSVARLCEREQARFRAIGTSETLGVLGVPEQTWEPPAKLPTLQYAQRYAQLDVAIVPLRPTRFNAGKSWLKMAEAAALGVPVVASPTPDNQRLYRLGVGILAERPKDWYVALSQLCASRDLREELSGKGHAVMAEWTIEDRIAPMVWDAWSAPVRV